MTREAADISVLCVDDEPGMADLVATYLERFDDRLSVDTIADPIEAYDRLDDVDCIVSDYDMPDVDGLTLLETVRADHPRLPFVLFTGRGSEDIAADAVSASVTDYMQKDSGTDQYRVLAQRIRNAVERYRLGEQADATTERAETILEASPDPILVTERSRVTYANPAAVDLLAASTDDDILGTTVDDLFVRSPAQPNGTAAVERLVVTVGEHRVPVDATARRVAWDGIEGVVRVLRETATYPVTDGANPYRASLFDSLFETSPDGILVTTSDWEIMTHNDRFTELWGVPESILDDADGERVFDAACDAVVDPERFREVINAQYENPDSTHHERIRLRDGAVLDQYSAPVYADDGGRHGFVWFYRDVTDEHRTAAALEESVDALRQLYEVTSDRERSFDSKLDTVLDIGAEYLDVPYGFVSRLDETTQTVVESTGDHPLLQPGETCPLGESYCRKTVETDEGLLAVQHAGESGWADDVAYETFELEAYVGGRVVVDGDLYGTVCFAGDTARDREFTEMETTFVELLTRWLSYELEEREYQADLEAKNDQLAEFASIVSHDLRNPLTVASGHLDLARDERDSEQLRRVADAHERMERLIEDILTLARDGDVVDDLRPVDVGGVAESAWRTVDTQTATLDATASGDILADASRLTQLFENLFRNSVEHGSTSPPRDSEDSVEHGGEDVTVIVSDLEDGFAVADDGAGFGDADPSKVFDAGYTTAEDGTGLGLRIVSRIAEAHGWTVEARESEAGGTRFEFTGVERP